jgi:hypothetical protein
LIHAPNLVTLTQHGQCPSWRGVGRSWDLTPAPPPRGKRRGGEAAALGARWSPREASQALLIILRGAARDLRLESLCPGKVLWVGEQYRQRWGAGQRQGGGKGVRRECGHGWWLGRRLACPLCVTPLQRIKTPLLATAHLSSKLLQLSQTPTADCRTHILGSTRL